MKKGHRLTHCARCGKTPKEVGMLLRIGDDRRKGYCKRCRTELGRLPYNMKVDI